ncbi:DUF3347 domain-containing protein [Catalinimonas sp. 4WD22]|uniref:DUF3347 domain-containing protein n=1 Tax=Catalinimonas locisalis TaxID=3133978 RepID=UPI003100B9FC
MKSMTRAVHNLPIIILLTVLTLSCGQRYSEEAQGRETELSGDEPDETALSVTEEYEYDPADTSVSIEQEAVPSRLQDHMLVVVSAYMNIGEALVNDNAETAKAEARELVNLLERNEQENYELEPEVRDFYTNAAHIIRQSAQTILTVEGLSEIRITYSAMSPATYKMAKLTTFEGQNLYYYFCPETFEGNGAYWLSSSAEANNPYAEGDGTCGERVGTI